MFLELLVGHHGAHRGLSLGLLCHGEEGNECSKFFLSICDDLLVDDLLYWSRAITSPARIRNTNFNRVKGRALTAKTKPTHYSPIPDIFLKGFE